MNEFKVSRKLFLKQSLDDVWEVISSKESLELFHPYCSKNKAISWGDIKVDELVYLNGVVFIREFTSWNPNHGFELTIGKRDGKKSRVKWEITMSNSGCLISISIWPYKPSKVSKILYPFVNVFIVRPKLKKYLSSVLKGLNFYLTNRTVVKKNQFGSHSWFS